MNEPPAIIVREIPQPATGGSSPNPGHNPLPLPAQKGEVWFAAKDNVSDIIQRIWLDGVAPDESGKGGWTVTPTEGAKGTLEYAGVDPERWTIHVTLDGWADGRDVQGDWDALCSLAEGQDGDKPPPEVWLSGPLPHQLLSDTWVIEKLVPTEERLIGGERGEQLRRARATLTLIESVFPTSIAAAIKPRKSKKKPPRKSKPARAGDTLVKIAARELGDPEKWREISKLNGGRHPDNVKPGEQFKLP